MTDTSRIALGTVYLIGAGPGDPGLITLRGIECLGRADVVLYDYLVNPAILEHASDRAELIGLGHHQVGRTFTPEEIVDHVLEHARKGKTVARLKGGDVSVFARGADETEALRQAGIPFEMVPGITSGLAAAAYCEIPITHHDDASAVALVVGQERHCKATSTLDYGSLAGFPGTLVFYMGVTRTNIWARGLIEHGKPPETPVAIVRWCTWSRQRTVRCRLDEVIDVVRKQSIRPPALFLVGKVVDRAPDQSWFATRPLFGTQVLVTGSPATSEKLRDRLTALGADVMMQPAIRIGDPPGWASVDAALDELDQYDWLVFSSQNGVDYFFRRLLQRGWDVRRLGNVKVATVGSSTADRLAQYHVRADLVPEKFIAESLAQELLGQARGRRFLLARASRGRQVLADQLRQGGASVDQVVVYSSLDVESPDPNVAAALSADEVDWITVTSSATAESLVRLYGDLLRKARLVSISPLTSQALRQLGHEPAAEASPHTMDALVEAIRHAGPVPSGKP